VRLGCHRLIENAVFFRVLREVGPEPAGDDLLPSRQTGSDGMLQLTEGRPVDPQAEHSRETTHGLRVVSAQQPRRCRMAELIPVRFEHTVCGKKAHDATQRIGVSTDRGRKISGGSRSLVQDVGDAKVCNYVKAPWETVTARDLLQCSKRVGFTHGTPL